MNHDKAYFTKLQQDNFIERGFDIIVKQNNEHLGVCGPRIYYGMTHEARVWPSVRYVSTGIVLEHLGTNMTIQELASKREDSVILSCNEKSLQTLTIGGWTIELCKYNREQVLEFLRKKGFKCEDPKRVWNPFLMVTITFRPIRRWMKRLVIY